MERRPNPEGWTQPRAPYNPYDPKDQRPPEGYPSEFRAPGSPRNWSQIPKEPTNYVQATTALKRLSYTPRPLSEIYSGQYKVLRRKPASGFTTGVRFMSRIATVVIVLGTIFFYRWNDGFDNIFSLPYRWQLRMRDRILGNLSPTQKEDLQGKQRGVVNKVSHDREGKSLPKERPEHWVALDRPSINHVIQAERVMQEREEAILRAVDRAKAKLASSSDLVHELR